MEKAPNPILSHYAFNFFPTHSSTFTSHMHKRLMHNTQWAMNRIPLFIIKSCKLNTDLAYAHGINYGHQKKKTNLWTRIRSSSCVYYVWWSLYHKFQYIDVFIKNLSITTFNVKISRHTFSYKNGYISSGIGFEFNWNRVWLRIWSHMTSHHTWGSVITLRNFGSVLGWPLVTFFGALTISRSRLSACVRSGLYMHKENLTWEALYCIWWLLFLPNLFPLFGATVNVVALEGGPMFSTQ